MAAANSGSVGRGKNFVSQCESGSDAKLYIVDSEKQRKLPNSKLSSAVRTEKVQGQFS